MAIIADMVGKHTRSEARLTPADRRRACSSAGAPAAGNPLDATPAAR